MSKIRVRSYLDGNAPQFNAASKNGWIPFLKEMFEQESYGNIIPTNHQIDLVNNQIIFEFTHDPGFSAGNLVQILGSGLRSFTENYFRVISNDGIRLYLKYDYNTLDPIPTDFDVSKLVVRHAPMDWEVLHSSDTQFSFRSKNENSSRTIITLKTSETPGYADNTFVYASQVYLSKIVDQVTGEISDSYVQNTMDSIAGATESPFLMPTAWSHYGDTLPLNNTSLKIPWYLIGDDRFFYLIAGVAVNTSSSRSNIASNYSRSTSLSTQRSVFLFGDPDKLQPDDPQDPTGFIFNTSFSNQSLLGSSSWNSEPRGTDYNYTTIINSPSISRSYYNAGGFFLRDYNNLPGKVVPINLHTFSFSGVSSESLLSYPGPFSHGVSFFPIYTSVITSLSSNGGGYLRSILPFAKYPCQSIRSLATNWVSLDYKVFKTQGKDLLNIVVQSSGSVPTHITSFELD